MARYDGGIGGSRGGWRGWQGGPYDRGFPGPGGMREEWPQSGRPDQGGYRGDWHREQGGGNPRGGRTFGSGNRTPGGGAYGGGAPGGGWDRQGGAYRYEGSSFGGGARSHGPGGFGGGNRSGGGARGGTPGGWRDRADADRGQYGGAYEEYGGYPGGPVRGEYWGGRTQERGYDAGFVREPFMPEEAYRRHPEYQEDAHHREWEAHQHDFGDDGMSDDDVRDSVYRRMRADAWLDPARIDVQVEDGVVTLTGEVDDFLKARYAWDDAWEADGVRGVVNNLTVRADEPRSEPHGDVVPQTSGERTEA